MPDEFSAHHDKYMQNYLDTGDRKIIGIGREVRGRHCSGKIFPFELSVGEAVTSDVRQFIGIIRDITKRKETEQRIAELQAQLLQMARVSAIDEMGAAIAHELNQPLTALMLYLQAGKKRIADSTNEANVRGMEIIDKAAREARRASDIIQRMRSFIEHRDPDRKRVKLRDLVDEAIELTVVGNRAADVTFVNEDPAETPLVDVDTVQIQQIVVNLIRNALEVLRDRPDATVTTTCEQRGDWAVLRVEDNGPGIPEKVRETLFQAFETNKRSGLGLGLAISRSIAQSHGGDLDAGSGRRGRGARFELKLPLASGEAGG